LPYIFYVSYKTSVSLISSKGALSIHLHVVPMFHAQTKCTPVTGTESHTHAGDQTRIIHNITSNLPTVLAYHLTY